jgi:ABC-2 type transport system permease protein
MKVYRSVILAATRAQAQMSRRNVQDLYPILTIPFSSVLALAVLQNGGREDLAGYALVAAVLMSLGQMAFFTGSEILANERWDHTFELVVASPTRYYVPLLVRVVVLTSIGLVGFFEAWIIARLVFDIVVSVHHPAVLIVTLLLTVAAASATTLITSTLFCFGKTTRTYQGALTGPLYLLAGVLVPVAYLPELVQPLSRGIFLFWSADLLRDSLQPAPIDSLTFRLGAIVSLGLVGGIVGSVLFSRLLTHLRREGTLGL